MRPRLKQGRSPVQRDLRTLQLGRSPWRSVVLSDDHATRSLLALLDGTRTWAQVVASHGELGFDAARTEHVMRVLRDSGALDDASLDPRALRALDPDVRPALLDAVAAWDQARPEPGAGLKTLRRRQACWVEVDGSGPLAEQIAALLARSGLGHLSTTSLVDAEAVVTEAASPSPDTGAVPEGGTGSVTKADEAQKPRRRARAKKPASAPDVPDEVKQARSRRRRRTAPTPEAPDLVVVVGPGSSPRARRLVRVGVAHLVVEAIDGAGLVGPLVLPGRTACGDCVEARRSLDDPARAWVALNAPDEVGPLDPVTLEAVAALAAAQALQQLEQRSRPASVNAQLVLGPDGAVPVHHPVTPTSRCGCTWEVSPHVLAPTMAG